MVSLDLAIFAEKLLYFENLVIPLEKDKKSFLHGVHKTKIMCRDMNLHMIFLFYYGILK
jgi:hypothetical protein